MELEEGGRNQLHSVDECLRGKGSEGRKRCGGRC